MARFNYYRFPEDVKPYTRYLEGADAIGEATCAKDQDRYYRLDNPHFGCPHRTGEYGCIYCEHLIHADYEDTISGISVSRAKQLLKEYGGAAYTLHIDRDGGVFETTPIRLSGNNSRHKYNRHL